MTVETNWSNHRTIDGTGNRWPHILPNTGKQFYRCTAFSIDVVNVFLKRQVVIQSNTKVTVGKRLIYDSILLIVISHFDILDNF